MNNIVIFTSSQHLSISTCIRLKQKTSIKIWRTQYPSFVPDGTLKTELWSLITDSHTLYYIQGTTRFRIVQSRGLYLATEDVSSTYFLVYYNQSSDSKIKDDHVRCRQRLNEKYINQNI